MARFERIWALRKVAPRAYLEPDSTATFIDLVNDSNPDAFPLSHRPTIGSLDMPTPQSDQHTPCATIRILADGPAFDLLISRLEVTIETAVTKALRTADEQSKSSARLQPALAPADRRRLAELERSKGPLMKTADVARLLGISQRHLWTMYSSGLMPAPVYLGRAVRWVTTQLEEWIAAGCPTRERWEAMGKR